MKKLALCVFLLYAGSFAYSQAPKPIPEEQPIDASGGSGGANCVTPYEKCKCGCTTDWRADVLICDGVNPSEQNSCYWNALFRRNSCNNNCWIDHQPYYASTFGAIFNQSLYLGNSDIVLGIVNDSKTGRS